MVRVERHLALSAEFEKQPKASLLTEIESALETSGYKLTVDASTSILEGNNWAITGQLQERENSDLLKVRIKTSHLVHKAIDMKREVYMLNLIKTMGYPTPKIFYFGQTPEGMPFMVQEFIDGISVRDIPPDNRGKILDEIQNFFVHLHSISFPGFGRLNLVDNQWRGSSNTWLEALQDKAKVSFQKMYELGILNDRYLEQQLLTLLETNEHLLDFNQGVILHGDAGLINFLAKGDELAGIIDPEFAVVGDPAWEFAGRVHQGYRDYPVEFMITYFDRVKKSGFPIDEETFYHRGRIYSACILADVIPYLWEAGNVEASKCFIPVLPREIDKAY